MCGFFWVLRKSDIVSPISWRSLREEFEFLTQPPEGKGDKSENGYARYRGWSVETKEGSRERVSNTSERCLEIIGVREGGGRVEKNTPEQQWGGPEALICSRIFASKKGDENDGSHRGDGKKIRTEEGTSVACIAL